MNDWRLDEGWWPKNRSKVPQLPENSICRQCRHVVVNRRHKTYQCNQADSGLPYLPGEHCPHHQVRDEGQKLIIIE